MLRRVWDFLHIGWRAVTEAHTVWWIVESLLPAGLITAAVGFYSEHSPAVLVIVFAFVSCLSFITLLAWLGYRRDARGIIADAVSQQPGEIQARTERRYLTVADAITYMADQSEWRARLRAAPPNARGMKEVPRYAAIDEMVRAARNGNIAVFGRLNRTGEHLSISQQYWLYARFYAGES